MDICTAAGSKVKFINENGYDSEREATARLLLTDIEYTVERMQVGGWNSSVYLVEFPGKRFNTVMFENVGEFELYNWFGLEYLDADDNGWKPAVPAGYILDENGKLKHAPKKVEPPVPEPEPVRNCVITLCSSHGSKCYLNLTEEQAQEKYMDEFGYEATRVGKVWFEDAFDYLDIKPSITVGSSWGDEF